MGHFISFIIYFILKLFLYNNNTSLLNSKNNNNE